jgi:hypothetical protein
MGEKVTPAQPDWSELYDKALAESGVVLVQSVEGRPVTRYGTKIFIGAVRDPDRANKLVYTSDPVTLPRDEAERYRREYLRHITEGDLVLSTSEVGAPRKPPTAASVTAKGPPHAVDEGGRQ